MGGLLGKPKQAVAGGAPAPAASGELDYDLVRKAILVKIDDPAWDDGSWGPIFVRLGWHAAGTFDKSDGSGGTDGGCIRHKPQSEWGFNAGLHHARERLHGLIAEFPGLTYADLYSLASIVAIEHMGGPRVPWRAGRVDDVDGKRSPPDGRLPDGTRDGDHLRAVFGRMGFNDRDIVALSGAHSLGRCHTDRSGFTGPWTRRPTRFTNLYYNELLVNTWTKKSWAGPPQWEDPTGDLMMLATDLVLIQDEKFRPFVELYAQNEEAFFNDFSAAFVKLQENGVAAFNTNQGDKLVEEAEPAAVEAKTATLLPNDSTEFVEAAEAEPAAEPKPAVESDVAAEPEHVAAEVTEAAAAPAAQADASADDQKNQVVAHVDEEEEAQDH